MKISVRDKDNDLLKPLEIITLKGEDGITPNIQIGTVTTVGSNQEAIVVKRGTKEEPIFDFNIPRGASGGSGSDSVYIDDNTISTDKTWSSSKIEDFTLTNVGTIWKEINGEQMVIDSTMDGFLREVEILGNTIQNQDDLPNIQHLGTWNEAKQGYEIEIVVSNSSNKDDSNYQEYRTTILLPCQLMKVGDISDRLFWDKNKGKYIIEKKILSSVVAKSSAIPEVTDGFSTVRFKHIMAKCSSDRRPYAICNRLPSGNFTNMSKDIEMISTHSVNNSQINFKINKNKLQTVNNEGFNKWLNEEETIVYFKSQAKFIELIDTSIREEIKLPTFINNTYVTVNGGIQGSIKAKAPVDGGKVIGVLQEENKELKLLVDITMLTTDEILTILEPLLVDVLSTNSSSKIIDMYVAMVKNKRGLKTIDEVPLRYREQVKEMIEKEGEM